LKALIYDKFQGPIQLLNVKDPTPKNNGVVLKVTATGLCRSDWHGWMGHDPDIVLPHVPGHELAGTIVAKGKNIQNFKLGDRVTVPFVCGCGTCVQCSSGNHQICNNQSQPGFTHWGSFAEYVRLDFADTNLVKIPEEISDITAATLGCRFITAYRAVVEQAKIKGGQYLAVHGCGGVGLSAIMIANALGAQVIAIDIDGDTLEFAKAIGAVGTIKAGQRTDVVAELKEMTKGGAHASIDALGSATTCFNSVAGLRKQGRHVQVGLMAGKDSNPRIPMDMVIAKELELLGSHGMQAFKYPEMLEMILNGKLRPEKLIEKTITLEAAKTALPAMDSFKNTGVVVIDSF